MSDSRRNLYTIITVILTIVAVVYPFAYSHWPTQTTWSPVVQSSKLNSSTQVSYDWSVFEETPYFPSGTTIRVNVTYISSGPVNASPEACIFTATSFKNLDVSKPIDPQAIDCEGPQSYTYNATTNQYTILFVKTLPESNNYVFLSKLISLYTPGFQIYPPTITISEPSNVSPLQSFDPQLVQVVAGVLAAVFGLAAAVEHGRR